MRGGKIIEEKQNDKMLEKKMCENIEDVLLKLRKLKKKGKRRRRS